MQSGNGYMESLMTQNVMHASLCHMNSVRAGGEQEGQVGDRRWNRWGTGGGTGEGQGGGDRWGDRRWNRWGTGGGTGEGQGGGGQVG